MSTDGAPKLLLIELNEINFDAVQHFAARGQLPTFHALLRRHGLSETQSETVYENIEPWIQWVTAHSGLSFAEHGLFRLGDAAAADIPQIWEQLEQAGFRVGALSPMNAVNRLQTPCFFIPDPWTPTTVSGPPLAAQLHAAIAQAVQDNADRRLHPGSLLWLAAGIARFAPAGHWARYVELAAQSRLRPWNRALLLDQLLFDLFTALCRRTRPDFASLFVNAGAHIQHHYMLQSPLYGADARAGAPDPMFDMLRFYDDALASLRRAFPSSRLMLATGLHQTPFPYPLHYWRLRDHEGFLRACDVDFVRAEARMSRDFLIYCDSDTQAADAARTLATIKADDGVPLFEIDNRGSDLFVMLTYPHAIDSMRRFLVGNRDTGPLAPHVTFVALKNGEHHGTGYFLDTGCGAADAPASFDLAEVAARVMAAMIGDQQTRAAA